MSGHARGFRAPVTSKGSCHAALSDSLSHTGCLSFFTPVPPFFSLLLLSAETRELELKAVECFESPHVEQDWGLSACSFKAEGSKCESPPPSDAPPASGHFQKKYHPFSLQASRIRECSHKERLNFFSEVSRHLSLAKDLKYGHFSKNRPHCLLSTQKHLFAS